MTAKEQKPDYVDPIVEKMREKRKTIVEEGLFDKLPITKNTFEKLNQYSRVLRYLFGKDLECMGYLVAPLDKKDGIVYDAVYIHDQRIREGEGSDVFEGKVKTMDEINKKNYRILGFWHSHGKYNVRPTDTDRELVETLSASDRLELEVDSENMEFDIGVKDNSTIIAIPVPDRPYCKIEITVNNTNVEADVVYKKSKSLSYWYVVIINNKGKSYAEIDYTELDEKEKRYKATKSNKDIEFHFIEEDQIYDLADLVDEVFERTVYEHSDGILQEIKQISSVARKYKNLKHYLDKNVELSEIFEQVIAVSLDDNAKETDKDLMEILKGYTPFKIFSQIKTESMGLQEVLKEIDKISLKNISFEDAESLIKQESGLDSFETYKCIDDARLEPIAESYGGLKEKVRAKIAEKKDRLYKSLESELKKLSGQGKRFAECNSDSNPSELVEGIRRLAGIYSLLENPEKVEECEKIIADINEGKEKYEGQKKLLKNLKIFDEGLETILQEASSISVKDVEDAVGSLVVLKSRFTEMQAEYKSLEEADDGTKRFYDKVEQIIDKKESAVLRKITSMVNKVREKYTALDKKTKTEENIRELLGNLSEYKKLLAKLGRPSEKTFGDLEEVLNYDIKSIELDEDINILKEKIGLLQSVNPYEHEKADELITRYLEIKRKHRKKNPVLVEYADVKLNRKLRKVQELHNKEMDERVNLNKKVEACMANHKKRLEILDSNLATIVNDTYRLKKKKLPRGIDFLDALTRIKAEVNEIETRYDIFELRFKKIKSFSKHLLQGTKQKLHNELEAEKTIVLKNLPRHPRGVQILKVLSSRLGLDQRYQSSIRLVERYLRQVGLNEEAELVSEVIV